jgi:serine protease Do
MHSTDMTIGGGPGRASRDRARAGVAAVALLLAGSIAGWTISTPDTARVDAATAAPPDASAARTIGSGVDSYAATIEETAPAVVTVRASRRVSDVSGRVPDHPLLREFFGDRFGQRQQPERREGGMGSGVIVRPDGYILTNQHVIGRADQVTVELVDGRTFTAEVVGSDQATDLAVLKIDGANLATLPLGDSDAVRVGDVVLAIGNPMGLGQTVTMGIVSAKGRSTGGAGHGSFEDFIQTDAPINRGNSGGALVNTRGELIGINSQILSPSGGNIGIGFAIPANMAGNVMTQLIEHGAVRRGMLGVTIQPVTSDIARSLGLEQVAGAIVSSVQPGSPAEKGGVRRGDVVTAVDGQAVRDSNVLRNQIAQMQPGSSVALTVVRDGRVRQLTVTLAELDGASATPSASRDAADGATGFGVSVEPLTPERARQLGVQASTGVVVTRVDAAGKASTAGLQLGDVIEEVDGKAMASASALRNALQEAGDRPALLLVHRDGATIFLPLS